MFGDFYYRDDTDGKIISARYYQSLKQQRREENWDYSLLNQAASQKEYQDMLREKEMELLSEEVLDRPVYGRDSDNAAREAGIYL